MPRRAKKKQPNGPDQGLSSGYYYCAVFRGFFHFVLLDADRNEQVHCTCGRLPDHEVNLDIYRSTGGPT